MEKEETKLWAVCLIILTTLLASSGQLLLKMGSKAASLDLSLLTNYPLIAGCILYGIGAILLIVSLKGGELSVLYPIIATSYIWVSLLSLSFLGESMNMWKWLGIASIILGVSFIGKGGRKKK